MLYLATSLDFVAVYTYLSLSEPSGWHIRSLVLRFGSSASVNAPPNWFVQRHLRAFPENFKGQVPLKPRRRFMTARSPRQGTLGLSDECQISRTLPSGTHHNFPGQTGCSHYILRYLPSLEQAPCTLTGISLSLPDKAENTNDLSSGEIRGPQWPWLKPRKRRPQMSLHRTSVLIGEVK